MTLVTMRSRYAVLALLLLLGVTGLTACGDDSSTSGTKGTETALQAAPTKGGSDSNAEEYKGVFADGEAICGTSTHKQVAEIVGSRGTSPRAIARAFARGYQPKLRKRAYAGCLAGLR